MQIFKIILIIWSVLWCGGITVKAFGYLPKANDLGMFWLILLSLGMMLLGTAPFMVTYFLIKRIIEKKKSNTCN